MTNEQRQRYFIDEITRRQDLLSDKKHELFLIKEDAVEVMPEESCLELDIKFLTNMICDLQKELKGIKEGIPSALPPLEERIKQVGDFTRKSLEAEKSAENSKLVFGPRPQNIVDAEKHAQEWLKTTFGPFSVDNIPPSMLPVFKDILENMPEPDAGVHKEICAEPWKFVDGYKDGPDTVKHTWGFLEQEIAAVDSANTMLKDLRLELDKLTKEDT
jgi:hypothetical protein